MRKNYGGLSQILGAIRLIFCYHFVTFVLRTDFSCGILELTLDMLKGGMLPSSDTMQTVVKRVLGLALFIFLTGMMIQPGYAMDTSFVYGAVELNEKIESMDTAMKTANMMAECARALPIDSADAELVLGIAQNHYEMANELKSQYESELEKQEGPHLEYDVYTICNLSKEAFDYILEGTNLAGMGYAFEDLEQTYGINGLFAAAIAKLESDLGHSPAAINKNNFFGMRKSSYSSKYEGIIGFGELMNTSTYQGKSLSKIASIYCPPSPSKWVSNCKFVMQQYWTALEEAEQVEEPADVGTTIVAVPGFLKELCAD